LRRQATSTRFFPRVLSISQTSADRSKELLHAETRRAGTTKCKGHIEEVLTFRNDDQQKRNDSGCVAPRARPGDFWKHLTHRTFPYQL
jgi:hypothetical protein